MGLFGAMTASVSALSSQGAAISVISDNLANTNTVGYKAGRSLFAQLVTSSGTSGTSYNAGGVSASVQRAQNTQGSLISSTSVTDLAITGTGFFRVADASTNNSDTSYFYTRAGDFTQNKEGFLVNSAGFYLQGWETDSDGTILDVQTPVAVGLGSVGVSSQETSSLSITANLNSTTESNTLYDTTAAIGTGLDTVLADPTLADFLADVRVYDAQGGARDMTIAFTKRAANFWDWQLYTDGSNIQGGTTGTNTRVSRGTLQFNTTGSLAYATGTSVDVTWSGGVEESTITLDFGDYTGGKIAALPETATATVLDYREGVLGIAAEDSSLAAGTYTLRMTAAGTFSLGTGTGAGFVATETGITIGATGTREIYFPTSQVRITVSNDYDETSAAYLTDGTDDYTFAVSAVSALEDGVGTDGVIQFSANSNVSSVNQDGFGAGTLASVQVDENGYVNGTFTNGETKKLYRLALGVFQNANGLEPLSGNLLRVTDSSGQALLKQPNVGGTGRVVGGSLEGSTTDIAGEFSQMIVAQRAFQASSSVISTVDQMLNNLLQIR